MSQQNSSPGCQAFTKSGRPCRAAAMAGGLCFFHANPNKAAELGRIGGKKNGHPPIPAEPLPNLDNATALRDAVARLIADVYSGRVHPRIAAGLAPLMHLQIRLLEKTELEQRLAEVERQLGIVFKEILQHSGK
jgi:hypothetical protein